MILILETSFSNGRCRKYYCLNKFFQNILISFPFLDIIWDFDPRGNFFWDLIYIQHCPCEFISISPKFQTVWRQPWGLLREECHACALPVNPRSRLWPSILSNQVMCNLPLGLVQARLISSETTLLTGSDPGNLAMLTNSRSWYDINDNISKASP